MTSSSPDAADTREHKVVTVLCGGLAEAADWAERLGAEAMHDLMQTLLAQVQHIVQRYSGMLVQVNGGGVCGAVWSPGSAREPCAASGVGGCGAAPAPAGGGRLQRADSR
jgi:class 3 adenylate cyclase